MHIYLLTSEDLFDASAPMGQGSNPPPNFILPFSSLPLAKVYAERDYEVLTKKEHQDIKWKKASADEWCSEDLGFVMYFIERLKVDKRR